MQGGKAPTARQKRWHDAIAKLGCVFCGDANASIHHCAGSTARHNKIWIGQDWVIPVCYECHQGAGGLHGDLSRIREFCDADGTRKEFEKAAFSTVLARVIWNAMDRPEFTPSNEVFGAILEYRR